MPTIYTVTGQSRTKPANLPTGMRVQERTVQHSALVPGADGQSLAVNEHSSWFGTKFLRFTPRGIYSFGTDSVSLNRAGVARLRDELNKYLATLPDRVLKDRDGDLWFEAAPNKFYLTGGWQSANANHRRTGNGQTHDEVNSAHGPVVDVSTEHTKSLI